MGKILPGMYPNKVKPQFINKSTPQPFSARTPRGGKIIARINLQISEHVRAILTDNYFSKLNWNFD